MGFFIFIFLSTTVFADAKNRGSIGTDSVFYRLDIAFDNLFINLNLKNVDDVAEERLAEMEEAQNTDDIKGLEIAKEHLDKIEHLVTDEKIKEDIEKENEDIKLYAGFTEQELIDAINKYSKIELLTADVSSVYVQTEGLEEKNYLVTADNGKVISISEVAEIPEDTETIIKVAYSKILLSIKDVEYREKKLDQLLKMKLLFAEEQTIVTITEEEEVMTTGY